jgi:hypothetical protein
MAQIVGEKRIKLLVKAFEQIEERMQNISFVLNAIDTIDIKSYNKIRKAISEGYDQLRAVSNKWSKLAIPSTYKQNASIQISRIKKLKFKPPQTITKSKFNNSKKTKKAIKDLVDDFDKTMNLRLTLGQRSYFNLIALTREKNIVEADQLAAEAFRKGKTISQFKKELQQKLMRNALDKKYVTIIDKNGSVSQYTTSKYAEMLARTKLSEAQAASTLDVAENFGSDLIQISSHNTTSPQCIPFEGKIFSISGKDEDFAPLTEVNPFHPNCQHTSTIVFKEMLELRGIKKYSDFSLGKTTKHPTRTKFIPVDELEKRIDNAKKAGVKNVPKDTAKYRDRVKENLRKVE